MDILGTRSLVMNIAASLQIDERRFVGVFVSFVCATLFGLYSLHAEESSTASASSEEESAEGKNWIELGIGGLIINGDAAQFKQEHRMSGDVFGGIQDLHFEQAVGKKGQFSIDGHA